VAGSGRVQALAICGEPGIGKTRMLEELLALGEDAGQMALSGRAAQFERDIPFAIFVQALDGYLSSQDGRRFEPLGRDRLVELARIFPALSEFADPGRPAIQAERYRAHFAVSALLDRLARSQPLLLALDDLQWADDASLELASHLLRRPPAPSILIALSYRPGEAPARLTREVEDAVRSDRLARVNLVPLSEAEATSLCSDGASAEERARLLKESGGNPFYLQQLARVPDRPTRIATRTSANLDEVPAGVAAALALELDGLSEGSRRLLAGGAIVGDPFALELAAAGGDCSETAARDAVDELLVRQLIYPTEAPRRFRFRHPIVHRAIYAGLQPGWSLGAHARVKDALVRQGASAGELAHHVAEAAEPGDEEAVAILERAAHDAAPLAPGSAAQWLASALRLVPAGQPERRLMLLIPRAISLAAAGRLEESEQALVEALALVSPEAQAVQVKLVAVLAAVRHLLGEHSNARDVLHSTLASLSDPDSIAAAGLHAELAVDAFYVGDWEQTREWADMALQGATAAAEPPLQVVAEALLCFARMGLGEIGRAEEYRTSSARLFDSLDDSQLLQRLDAAYYLGYCDYFMERYEDGVRHLGRGIELSRSSGQDQFLTQMRSGQAWCLIYCGRGAEASQAAEEAIEAAQLVGSAEALSWALGIRSWIAMLVGDFDLAQRTAELAVTSYPEKDITSTTAAWHAHLAVACVEKGQHQRCIEQMQLAGSPDFPKFFAVGKPHWCEALTRAALGLGRLTEAESWAARGELLVERLDLPIAHSAAQRGRARVLIARDRPGDAADLLLVAVNALRERGAPLEAARSRILAGQALAAAGRTEDAIAELETAHEELNACGAPRRQDEAARALRQLGRRKPRTAPRRAATSGIEALSGREREIAELAADAKTNREIAATLFISEKTVEKHLSKVFAKLGVKGRAAIGAKLASGRDEPNV
jgi:DNA-binding CsgD family transcriptional regulator